MQRFGLGAAVLGAFFAIAGQGQAQRLSDIPGPRELPPADYDAAQYVDSAGCVYIRAGVGASVVWVPRVTRDRKQVCGYPPSLPPSAQPAETAPAQAQAQAQAQTQAQAQAQTRAPETSTAAPPRPAPAAAPKPAPAAKLAARAAQPAKAAAKARHGQRRMPAAAPAGGAVRLVRVRHVDGSETLCVSAPRGARRYLLSDGRRVTSCSDREEADAAAFLSGLGAPGLAVAPGPAPAAAARRAEALDATARYVVVWSNGPLKAAARGGGAKPAVAPAGRYIQVGAYAVAANSARSQERLAAMGLPVVTIAERVGRQPVRTVLAGPFASGDDLARHLAAIRRAGWADAFVRR